MKRHIGIDYAKGLAILLLIVSHCVIGEGILKTWIFSFHMPIFFVVCGVLSQRKYPNEENIPPISTFAGRRAKQLLIPYCIFGMVLIAFFQALNVISGQPLTLKTQLLQLVTLQGIESMWFIPCYFVAELIFLFFIRKLHSAFRMILMLAIVVVVSCFAWFGMPENEFLRWMIKILIGIVFVYSGFEAQKHQLIKSAFLYRAIVGIIICFVLCQLNGFVGIGALQLQNGIIFFLVGIVTSICILCVCEFFSDKICVDCKVLKRFGQSTIVVVCTNNLIIECIWLLDYKITGNILLHSGFVGEMVLALLVVIVECVLIQLADGVMAPLYGKKRRVKNQE